MDNHDFKLRACRVLSCWHRNEVCQQFKSTASMDVELVCQCSVVIGKYTDFPNKCVILFWCCAVLYLFNENVVSYQAKSFMIHNVRTTY